MSLRHLVAACAAMLLLLTACSVASPTGDPDSYSTPHGRVFEQLQPSGADPIEVDNPTFDSIGTLTGTQAELDEITTRTSQVTALQSVHTQPDGQSQVQRYNADLLEAITVSRINDRPFEVRSLVDGVLWQDRAPVELFGIDAGPRAKALGLSPAYLLLTSFSDASVYSFEQDPVALTSAWGITYQRSETELVAQVSVSANGLVTEIVRFAVVPETDGRLGILSTQRFTVLETWTPVRPPCETPRTETSEYRHEYLTCEQQSTTIDLVAWDNAVHDLAEEHNVSLRFAEVTARIATATCADSPDVESPSVLLDRALETWSSFDEPGPPDREDVDALHDALIADHCQNMPMLPWRLHQPPHGKTDGQEMVTTRYERSGQWLSLEDFGREAAIACWFDDPPRFSEYTRPDSPHLSDGRIMSLSEQLEIWDLHVSGDCDMPS